MWKLCLLVVALIASCSADCNTQDLGGKFSRCQTLRDGMYDIFWNINGNDLTIAARVQVPNAWVGFGTSVNGGMRGADIAITRKVNGKYVTEDRHVPGLEAEPTIDAHQDVTLQSATTDKTSTTVIFTRKLVPCDTNEDLAILADDTPIIFAWGTEFGYHGENRGSAFVNFHNVPVKKELPSDTKSANLTFPIYNVPSKDTTYACFPVELPYDQKYHVVRWRPIITKGNDAYVHHMVLYTCSSQQNNTSPEECGMVPSKCTGFLIAWSIGQPGNDWLDEYALPIGNITGRYGVLQMHYNNPNQVSGIVDNSGLEIFYSTQLRKYDMGMLVLQNLGVLSKLVIPPHVEEYEQVMQCPGECTAKYPYALNMVGYFPHMHTLGSKIFMKHVRNGTELTELHRDDHYDFGRQQVYPLNTQLVPGDSLTLHCIWNSMSRTVNTTGGESSQEEMCVVIMQYWPAIPSKAISIMGCGTVLPSPNATGTLKGSCLTGTMNFTANPPYIPLPAAQFTCLPADNDNSGVQLQTLSVLVMLLISFIVM